MNTKDILRRGLALGTVMGALAAPASAAPVEQLVPSTANGDPTRQAQPVRVVKVDTNGGFDWGDAGIGASGLLALAAIASGTVIALRHRPDTRHPVA